MKEALIRAHKLLEQVVGLIDPEEHKELYDAIEAELLPCDEEGQCPATAITRPYPTDFTPC
jgi:hypothetical protein